MIYEAGLGRYALWQLGTRHSVSLLSNYLVLQLAPFPPNVWILVSAFKQFVLLYFDDHVANSTGFSNSKQQETIYNLLFFL